MWKDFVDSTRISVQIAQPLKRAVFNLSRSYNEAIQILDKTMIRPSGLWMGHWSVFTDSTESCQNRSFIYHLYATLVGLIRSQLVKYTILGDHKNTDLPLSSFYFWCLPMEAIKNLSLNFQLFQSVSPGFHAINHFFLNKSFRKSIFILV